MVEESVVRTLIGAINEGEYQQIIGYAVILGTVVARWFSEGRFSVETGRWISSSSAVLAGIGVALAAGGVWWQAVLIGGVAAPTSRGFWEMVRALLPERSK